MVIEKVNYIWMDDRLVKWDEANIHIMTHALHYGTGVFEGIRGYFHEDNVNLFRLDDHLNRLYNSAKIHFMEIPHNQSVMRERIIQLVVKNEIKQNCYIRPLIYRGFGEFGLNPLESPVQCAIIAFPIGLYLREEGVNVRTSSWMRTPDVSLPSAAKTSGGYVNSILAKVEALKSGCDEAIMLDTNGYLAEGTGANIFLVKNDKIYTPPISSSVLEGITRKSVIQIACDEVYEVMEIPLLKSELYVCEEAFFSGTAAEITPILQVDDRIVGKGTIGKITTHLTEIYKKVINGEIDQYKHWLTPVY